MPETDRLIDATGWIDLECIEREATPELLMQLGIQLHLEYLPLYNTVLILEIFGVGRCRVPVQKADLQPVEGRSPDHVALNETVIQLTDQRFWLSPADNSGTNETLHIRLFSARIQVFTERFPTELQEKHDVTNAVFLVDSAPWLHAALHRHGLKF